MKFRLILHAKNTFFLFFALFLFFSCYKSKDDNFSATALSLVKLGVRKVNIAGDSLSQRSGGFSLSMKLGSGYSVKDFSVSGRTQVEWINDISRVMDPNPDILIVELGTNDAVNSTNTEFISHLNHLLIEVEKRTTAKIILTAIPLTDNPILQERIKQNNTYIRTLKGKYFIADIEAEFEKNKSQFRLYPINDNIHPEPIGYEIMGEVYKSVILGIL
ncbi:MAG: SGNH/GDSL hydrolase family protein [Leptospiraceae bacterium]|nr:SGNH/GDSL hydrolase family protein [Leptospiraceae bacterium]MCK6382277.1 SGNH/GDSL hydrolase family protein [Leptospiraceae bacterium]